MARDPTDERLRAVERALTDDDGEANAGLNTADGAVEERLADLEARVDELDAAVRAVRGYVGNVRHVNREVERTAEAALAATRTTERDPLAAVEPEIPGEPVEPNGAGEGESEEADAGGALARVRDLL